MYLLLLNGHDILSHCHHSLDPLALYLCHYYWSLIGAMNVNEDLQIGTISGSLNQ